MKRAVLISGVTALALTVTTVAATAHGKGDRDGPRGFGPRINFEQVDANSDGQVTRDELLAHAQARFAEADTNSDGALSADELEARAEGRRGPGAEKMIEHRDANGDGVLSFEEVQPSSDRIDRMFSRLDANEDGALSQEELEKAKSGKRGDSHRGEKKSDDEA